MTLPCAAVTGSSGERRRADYFPYEPFSGAAVTVWMRLVSRCRERLNRVAFDESQSVLITGPRCAINAALNQRILLANVNHWPIFRRWEPSRNRPSTVNLKTLYDSGRRSATLWCHLRRISPLRDNLPPPAPDARPS